MGAFEGNFRQLDRFDISELKAKVLALSDADWNAVTWRQQHFAVHSDTQVIDLIFDRDLPKENPTKHEKYFEVDCENLLAPFVEKIADHYGESGYLIRAILTRLKPKGVICAHVDTGVMFTSSRRFHIPIETNDKVIFTIGGETRVMREGEMWEINNSREHSVENGGEQSRIHLIVDWLPMNKARLLTSFANHHRGARVE